MTAACGRTGLWRYLCQPLQGQMLVGLFARSANAQAARLTAIQHAISTRDAVAGVAQLTPPGDPPHDPPDPRQPAAHSESQVPGLWNLASTCIFLVGVTVSSLRTLRTGCRRT